MATFDAGSIDASLTLDRSPFAEGLRLARADADAFESNPIDVRLDLEDREELARLREQLDAIQRDHVNIKVDTGEASAEIEALRAQVDTLGNSSRMGAGGGGFEAPGLMMTAIATLGPVAAAAIVPLTAALGGLASAGLSAGGGVGVLALGIVPVVTGFKKMETQLTTAQAALDKTVPGTQAYATALNNVNYIQTQLNEQYGPLVVGLGSLRAEWEKFKDATKDDAMGLIVQGMGIAQAILPMLIPVFQAFAPVAEGALTSIRHFIAGPEMAQFLGFLTTYGPSALHGFMDILANLGGVFVHLMEAFAPFSMHMIGGLDQMTARWDEWSKHLGSTQGFQDFIAYAEKEGPVMLDTLKQVAEALIAIGRGMAPLGGPNMLILRTLATTIKDLPPGVITALAVAFEAWTVGMWAYTAATTAAAIATALLDAAASPFIVAFVASAAAVIAVVAAIVALGIGIYELATKTQFFQTVWATVWGAAQAVWNATVSGFHTGIDALTTAWSAMSGVVTSVWGAISGAISTAVNAVTGFISGFISFVGDQWSAFWNTFGGPTEAAWGLVAAIFKLGVAIITFQLDLIKVVAEQIWAAVMVVFHAGAAVVTAVSNAIKTVVVGAWDYIRDRTVQSWNEVENAISGPLSTARRIVGDVLSAIRNELGTAWDYVSTRTTQTWDALVDKISGPLETAKSKISNAIGDIKRFFDSAGTWLVHAGEAIITGLISGITNKIHDLTNAVSHLTSIITDHLPGSPVKTGPLRVLNNGYAGGLIASMIAGGISDNVDVVRQAMGDLTDLTGMQLGGTAYINKRLGIDSGAAPAAAPAAPTSPGSDTVEALLAEVAAMRRATENMTDEFKRQNDNAVTLKRQGAT